MINIENKQDKKWKPFQTKYIFSMIEFPDNPKI